MNTAQLLQRCQSGDEAAIDTLVKVHHPALYRLAYSVLLNADDAEEAVQDTFIAALKSLERFNGEALKPWLYGIALNQCRMRLRRPESAEPAARRTAGSVPGHACRPHAPGIRSD